MVTTWHMHCACDSTNSHCKDSVCLTSVQCRTLKLTSTKEPSSATYERSASRKLWMISRRVCRFSSSSLIATAISNYSIKITCHWSTHTYIKADDNNRQRLWRWLLSRLGWTGCDVTFRLVVCPPLLEETRHVLSFLNLSDPKKTTSEATIQTWPH